MQLGPALCWRNRGVKRDQHEAELTVAPQVVKALSLEKKLVTADALYCQREFCRSVRDGGGDYLVIVKKNQPTLYADIELLFAQPPEDEVFASTEQHDRHGDRREVRKLQASTALCTYLDWPDVGQVCKIERVSVRKGTQTRQVRYAITSLGQQVGPDALLRHVRGHWGIENRLHYVRDVTLGEDASQVRKASAPEVMAALRSAVVGMLRQDGWTNIAAGLRHVGWQTGAALQLLGLSPP